MNISTSNDNQFTEANGYLYLFNHQNIQTTGDGNCWFRTLSLFFDGVEDNYKEYRPKIYEHAIKFKEDLRPFFVQGQNDNNDEILENYNFDEYIEHIASNYFYLGNIEILLTSQIYKLHIKNYKIENSMHYYYKQIAETGVEFSPNVLKVLFTNNNHYSLLVPADNNPNYNLGNMKNNSIEKLEVSKLTHKLDNLNIYLEKLCIIENAPIYYDDIKSFLLSLKKATNKDIKIDWKKIQYPPNIYNLHDNKKTRNKKTEHFRLKSAIINLMIKIILYILKNILII